MELRDEDIPTGMSVFDREGQKCGVTAGVSDGKLVVRTRVVLGRTYHVGTDKFTFTPESDRVDLMVSKAVLEAGAYNPPREKKKKEEKKK